MVFYRKNSSFFSAWIFGNKSGVAQYYNLYLFAMRPWLLFYTKCGVKWTGITIKTMKNSTRQENGSRAHQHKENP